jgi:hypothetical protein
MKPFIALFFLAIVLQANAQTKPVEHGHAHNDYQHKRPLIQALEDGFTSIEADVFLYHNDLIVSHDATGLNKKPNLVTLYLDPLKKRIEQNGGLVYKGYSTPVILMIDCKTGSPGTYLKLKEILSHYTDILTQYKGDSIIKSGPLQILISGNKPFKEVMNESTCYVTLDADLNSINQSTYDRITTRFSDPWGSYFTWNGEGDMPAEQLSKLTNLVKRVHDKHKQIRFYHIPDKQNAWKALLDAGVDWINTDMLDEYNHFCSTTKP